MRKPHGVTSLRLHAALVYVKETAALGLYLSNLSFIINFNRVEHSERFESCFRGRVGFRGRVMFRVKFRGRVMFRVKFRTSGVGFSLEVWLA